MVIRPQSTVVLTDQVIYDLKDSMRKASEMLDFNEDDDDDDQEYDYIDTNTVVQSTTSTPVTIFEIEPNSQTIKFSCCTLNFTNLELIVLLLLILVFQINI